MRPNVSGNLRPGDRLRQVQSCLGASVREALEPDKGASNKKKSMMIEVHPMLGCLKLIMGLHENLDTLPCAASPAVAVHKMPCAWVCISSHATRKISSHGSFTMPRAWERDLTHRHTKHLQLWQFHNVGREVGEGIEARLKFHKGCEGTESCRSGQCLCSRQAA